MRREFSERAEIENVSEALARQIEAWIPGSRARLSKRDPGWIIKTPGDRRSAIVVRVIELEDRIRLEWTLFGSGSSAEFRLGDQAAMNRAVQTMHRGTSGESVAHIVTLTPAQRAMLKKMNYEARLYLGVFLKEGGVRLDQVRKLKKRLLRDKASFSEVLSKDQRGFLEDQVNAWGQSITRDAAPLFARAIKKRGGSVLDSTAPNAWGNAAFRIQMIAGQRHETHITAIQTPNGQHRFAFAIWPVLGDQDSQLKWQVFDAMSKTSIARRLRKLGVVEEPGGGNPYSLEVRIHPGREEDATMQLPSIVAQIGAVVARALAPKAEAVDYTEEDDFEDTLFTGDELTVITKHGDWWTEIKKGSVLTVVKGGGPGSTITWRDSTMGSSSEGKPAMVEKTKKPGQYKLVTIRGPKRALTVKKG